MSKYAGVLFPPDRYEIIGPFKLPVYNDLTPNESRYFTQITKKQAQGTFALMQLAKTIAADKKISRSEALKLLGSMNNAEAETGEPSQELAIDYMEELQALNDNAPDQTEILVEYVTHLLRTRGELMLPDADDYIKIPDWSADDTSTIPQKMLEELFTFITHERDGWPTPEDTNKKISEPAAKKS